MSFEEIEFSRPDGRWLVTIGFYRRRPDPEKAMFSPLGELPEFRREERVVSIDPTDGSVLAVKVPH